MRDENIVERFQVWYGDDHGYLCYDYEDALKEAKENGGDEIEKLTWFNEDDYEDGKPADVFKVVWRK